MEMNNLKELYIDQLRDLYDAEKQLEKGLTEMADAANDKRLKDAFQQHLTETQGQIERLEQVFANLVESPKGKTCQAMKGLIKEAKELLREDAKPAVLDAGLIVAAQKVEHYEIAGYGSVATYAEIVGDKEGLKLLRETLNEEKMTDEKLTGIAKELINPKAAKSK